jgi:CheY-like chemotaxis protein
MPRSILVVDDDAVFRELAMRTLRGWGHTRITQAGSVATGVARALQAHPDVALVDVGLPDGDGFELCRRLRALRLPPTVVMISADADAGYPAAARLAGAEGFVPKDETTGATLRDLVAGS